eukprot:gnl/MRDRNA2_/MRDRNA2_219543_c0_seq1.p1 gnl/MRDRNA2_/MRDRNA2_219543_c0~~gnl/MRDRNA2_/MRDRNA2_219543_c0_seq1.p1  ORF type:complete len:171 (-),score=51.57 gnl/MRDRNA2_/MRDRNA2_219543_c0_seq1:13-525(-)
MIGEHSSGSDGAAAPAKIAPEEDENEAQNSSDNRASQLNDLKEKMQKKAQVEEKKMSHLQNLVRSTKFTLVTTAVICINGIIIGIETDHGDGSTAWLIIEIAFLICYLIELALRLVADGLEPLKNDGWVRFDAIVCAIALIDMLILGPALEGNEGEAKQIIMVIRILRLF